MSLFSAEVVSVRALGQYEETSFSLPQSQKFLRKSFYCDMHCEITCLAYQKQSKVARKYRFIRMQIDNSSCCKVISNGLYHS